MTETADQKTKRERSPGYPAIDLESAIERAQVVYDHDKRSLVPVATVVKHWGFSGVNSGAAQVILSALHKFGLLEDEGSGANRRVKLTDRAFTILQNPDEIAKTEALQEAALLPKIYRDVWQHYSGEVPSNDALRWELRTKWKFSDRGADQFIPEFRATIDYARLDASVKIGSETPIEGEHDLDDNYSNSASELRYPKQEVKRNPARRGGMSESGVLTIPVPVGDRSPVIVELEGKLSESEWGQFMAVLAAMKPGLVKSQSSESSFGSELSDDEPSV